MRRSVLALSLAIAVAGCAQRNATIPPAGAPSPPLTGTTAASTISITIPAPQQTSSAARKAAYISTASNSLVLTPQGQPQIVLPLSTTTPGCRTLNGARICTFRISLPTGTYSMRVALYATADGTGTPLAIVSTTTTIVANTTNDLNFTLNAVVSAMSVTLLPNGAFTSGAAASKTINVAAFDSAGAVIVIGTDALVDLAGSPVTIRLIDADTSGATSISPPTAGATPSTLSYNGGTPNDITVTASAVNAASVTIASAHATFSVASGQPRCGTASRRQSGSNSCTAAFLSFPLTCGEPLTRQGRCGVPYTDGPYTAQRMNTVLDHQMIVSSVNGLFQYGSKLKGGGDGKIVAFNGEHAEGPLQGTTVETRTCVQGTELNGKTEPSGPALHLATSPALVAVGNYDTDMVRHPGGCLDERYASYDEHPGYDYRAAMGSDVYAAYGGYVVNNGDWLNGHASARCVVTNLPSTVPPAVILHGCAAFNFVGIDHGNQYISQYGHLRDVDPALDPPCLTDQPPLHCEVWVNEGQLIGHSGDTGVAGSPHLHFEVIALIPGNVYDRTKIATYDPLHWTVVDPYGWVAGLADPLFYPMGDPLESFQKYHIWHSNLWK